MPENRPRGRPRAFDERAGAGVVQSLDRALGVLETLARDGPLTLSQIARAMDLSPATVHRILATFARRGMAESDPADQRWAVGANAFRLGSAFLRRTNLVERARAPMRRLMEETGETSNLGVARGDQVLFLGQVETHESIRAFFPAGAMSPLHASGIGKALLAAWGPEARERFFARAPLERFTERTITDPARLAAELDEIRARGWALDDEEKTAGMRCIAAAITDAAGEAAAGISISGPAHRLGEDAVRRLGPVVRAAADEVSAAIGGLVEG